MLPSVPTIRTSSVRVMRGMKFDIILKGSFPACSCWEVLGEKPGNAKVPLEGEVEQYSTVGSHD